MKRLNPIHALGALMALGVVGFCLVYPLLPVYDPYHQDLGAAFLDPFRSGAHPLGTDNLGRDVASRLALGGLVTLAIVLGVIILNAVLGTLLGTIAGYAGGRVEAVLMGWADVQLAVPILLIVIALAAAAGPSVWLMATVVAVTYWVGYARVARSTTLTLRGRDFVVSPRIQGAGPVWVLRRHVLPNVAGDMFILATSDIGSVLLLTSSFDFLGLGVQPPTPSWGLMISEGQKYLRTDIWLTLVPGIAIFLLVAGVNLLSQGFTAESRLRVVAAARPRRAVPGLRAAAGARRGFSLTSPKPAPLPRKADL